MPPTLITLLCLAAWLVTAVLVTAALMLSSQMSQREGVEQPLDAADAEHLQRFPRSR